MSRVKRFLSVLLVMTIIMTGIGLSLVASASGISGGAFGVVIFSGNSYPGETGKPSFSVRLQNVCVLSGLSNVVYGSVHANYNIEANTSFIIGIGEAVGTVTGSNIQTKVAGAPYVEMPDFSVYKAQIKADAIAAGQYFSGNFSIANKASVNLNNPLYVEGSANLTGISFSGKGCIYVEGKITITGTTTNYDSLSNICIYSGYTSTNKANAAIDFACSSKNFTGILYAPNGSILVTGSNYTFNGNIIGRVVDVSGSNKAFYSADVSESFPYAGMVSIAFNANGGTGGSNVYMTPGDSLTTPDDPTRDGYIFTGWLPSVPPSVPDEDSTYTAQWAYAPADYSGVNEAVSLAQAEILPANAANDPDYLAGGPLNIEHGSEFMGSYPRDEFTAESLAVLDNAVNAVEWGLYSPQQAVVDAYASSIIDAYNSLELAPADYSELNSYMSQAESLNREFYSAEELASVDEAMGFANAAVAAQYKKPAQYYTIDAISILLEAALLKLPADLTLIINTWNGFQADYVQSNYTTESWDNVVSYYNSVRNSNLPSWFQSDVAVFNDNLLVVISELVLKDVTYTVKYQTIRGVPLFADTTGSAKATDAVTEYAPDVPGYTAVQASIQKTMTGIDSENIIVFTYTAQSTKPSVNITKLAEGFKVSIVNWDSGNQYQIWSRQEFTDDLFTGGTASQWVLSQAYAPGFSGATEPDGSISFTIADFVSPDSNYTIAVRITDVFGNYLGEIRDSYTPEDVSEVKIAKVLVDEEYSTGREIREIKAGASMTFAVIGNNVPGTVFTAKVLEGGTVLTANSAVEFGWDIAALTPGTYTLQFTATNGATTDTKNISVQLYSLDSSIQYGNISALALKADEENTLPKAMTIDPDFTNGSFYYRVGEPGRKAIFTSGLFDPADSIEYTFTKYGIYQVSGFVNREYEVRIGSNYDDGFIKSFTVSRSQTEESSAMLTATVNNEPINLADTVDKGTAVRFEASADISGIGETPLEYSFWRYDAKGYALVKDWSSDNTLDWIPARVGNYTIEVRAKGADAGSYEVAKSVKVTVTDGTDQIAQDVVITLNEAELNANATARAPITVKANATSSNSEDLLYKFYVTDAAMGTSTLQAYSADSNCVWTPRKAGIYTLSVLVKNNASYGAYDAMESFEITVS